MINIFILFIGCGARKVDMHKTYEKEHTEIKTSESIKKDIDQKTDLKKDEKSEFKNTLDNSETQKKVDEEFTLIVEPTPDNPNGEYNLNINGKVISGKTNAKITITNRKKTDSIHKQLKTEDVKNTSKKLDSTGTLKDKSETESNLEASTDKVSKDKTKTTDKKEPWALNILGIAVGIGVLVFLYITVKSYIKKNPFNK